MVTILAPLATSRLDRAGWAKPHPSHAWQKGRYGDRYVGPCLVCSVDPDSIAGALPCVEEAR